MQRRRLPRVSGPDCSCPDCRAATRMGRIILFGSAAAWALILTLLFTLFV